MAVQQAAILAGTVTRLVTIPRFFKLWPVPVELDDLLFMEGEERKQSEIVIEGSSGQLVIGEEEVIDGAFPAATLFILLPAAAGAGIVPAGFVSHTG
jgi:hypothetical protein